MISRDEHRVTLDDIDKAEAVFMSRQIAAWLVQPTEHPEMSEIKEQRLAFSEIVAYARGDGKLSLPLARALKSDPETRLTLQRLMSQTAQVQFVNRAAASSANELSWTTDQGNISLHRSRAQIDQVYVLIELTEPYKTATRLVAMARDGRIADVTLDAAIMGVIRILAYQSDDVVQILETVDCQVYLT